MTTKEQSLKPRILAIIPCYNEEATIGSIVLKTKRYVDTVVIIDDGSTDDTVKIAQDAGAVVISHNNNYGKSASIKTGFNYALENNYDYIVTLDGDSQHNPDEIPLLLENIMNGNHDISIGYRYGNKTEMPMWRKIGKRVLDYATSAGGGGLITDSQCGFRAFSKKAIETIAPKLNSSDFAVESEQLIRAHEMNLKVANTYISCKYENLDSSTKNPASHGFSVLNKIIWIVAEKRPLLCISLPGFLSVIIGLFFGIQTLQYYNKTHVFLIPYAILVSIFLIIGILAMFIGLMLNVLPGIIERSRGE